MSFTQLCILLFVGLFFSGCVKWGLLPFLKKRFQEPPLFFLVFGCACIAAFSLFLGNVAAYLIGGQSVNILAQFVFLLSLIGLIASFVLTSKTILYWMTVWFLCLVGSLMLPTGISFLNTLVPGAFYCFAAAFLWTAFIAVMIQLDRIPLFSFLAFSGLYLGGAFVSADFLRTLPSDFYNTCIFVLCLLVCMTYFLKKNTLLSFGKPTVFLFSYLIGYAGIYLAALGKGVYLPIFVGYELLEISVALVLNLTLYHKFYPIQVPFLAERALMKNVMVGKVLQKIFIFCFVLSALGALCVHGSGNYILLAYVFLGIILYSAYLNLYNWGEPKARFRDLLSDIKTGVSALKNELVQVPLKKDKNVSTSVQKKSVARASKKTVTKKVTGQKKKKTVSKIKKA